MLTGGWREAEGRRDLLCSERFASQKGRRPEGGPESRASSAPREGCRARRGLFSSGDAWPWGCGGVLREKIGPFLPTQMALRQIASPRWPLGDRLGRLEEKLASAPQQQQQQPRKEPAAIAEAASVEDLMRFYPLLAHCLRAQQRSRSPRRRWRRSQAQGVHPERGCRAATRQKTEARFCGGVN